MLKKTVREANRWSKVKVCVSCLILVLFSAIVYIELPGAADYPHNASNGILCSACHTSGTPGAGDVANPPGGLCESCHNGVDATFVRTHSYGTGSEACINCHEPHDQMQTATYGIESYLYTSASTSVTSGTDYSWIIKTGAGWTPHQWAGKLVIGNIAASPKVFHKIYDNTADTLTVEGPLTATVTGDSFAIVYGALIDSTINGGPTKLFTSTGPNSFTMGTDIPGVPPTPTKGICMTCHTSTAYHRNDGTLTDHYLGEDCITCHSHEGGFGKNTAVDGGASGSGPGSGFHFGGSRNWDPNLDPLKAMNASNAMYDPNTKTCSGVYCHSNGAVNGADASNLVYKSTPAWYTGTFDANKCGSCHDNLPQYAGQSHYTATGFMGKEGGHLVGIHFDNIYNGSNGLLAAGAADPSSHGDPATSTTMTCYLCHNGEVSSTTIDTYANNLGSSSMKCANCHTSGTPTPLQIGAISNKNLHVNGLKNVTLANTTLKSKAQLADSSIPAGWTRHGTYKTAGSYDSATMSSSDWNSGTKTCTTACHNGQPVTWGATNITCVSCHTALP